MKIKLSKSQWKMIGRKAGWTKITNEGHDFTWEDNNGGEWEISYVDIKPTELYDENGRAFSDAEIMRNMIKQVQNRYGDKPIREEQIDYFIQKLELTTEEFFEKVQETNNLYLNERRIEQRDIDMGLHER